ncbi:hypothetical protein ALC57_11749 [Trachymyrmex cornetzi]|uniref:Uncharacterized protein n=1 Tax=Trachymyrmex cornetzi TaxID=471704 RepID=A0A151J202_9HYME|nr:hypothetical protein ALC57_11749 [Trachymyrmex cornetzi]
MYSCKEVPIRGNSVEFSPRSERHKSDVTHPGRRYKIGRVHHLAQKYFAGYAASDSEFTEIFPLAIERHGRWISRNAKTFDDDASLMSGCRAGSRFPEEATEKEGRKE